MKLTLFPKLFLSLFTTSLAMVLVVSGMINFNFKTGFQSYLNQTEQEKLITLNSELLEIYSATESWQMLRADPRIWNGLLESLGEPPQPERRPFNGTEPDLGARQTNESRDLLSPMSLRLSLRDAQDEHISGVSNHRLTGNNIFIQDIVWQGTVVGRLKLDQKSSLGGPLVDSFTRQQQKSMFWIVTLAALGSMIIAWLLVKRTLQPLKKLQSSARVLSEGEYGIKVDVTGNDELAELSRTFNQLSETLESNKESREQWITDISHELRTPIAVLRSELEAIQDGIRKPEPQHIDSMHNQTLNLGNLVEDLYQLSRSDSGEYYLNFHEFDVVDLIKELLSRFAPRAAEKNLNLSLDIISTSSFSSVVRSDDKALTQLISNLLENSLRYTDAPGNIVIKVRPQAQSVEIVIDDTAPTVEINELPRLFDRLYRIDKSRSREFGGSGLGLSICKSLSKMLNADIQASQSDLGGLGIEITLNKGLLDER